MFKIYSKGCEQALKVLTQITPQDYERKFLAKDICRKAKVSETSTRKSLQLLVQCGILHAVTGPGGGYQFSRHPNKISLLSIIQAVDGEKAFERCIMGLAQCGSDQPCPVHDTWAKMKKDMLTVMKKKTLHQLIKSAKGRQ